jgi:hypothetical protein
MYDARLRWKKNCVRPWRRLRRSLRRYRRAVVDPSSDPPTYPNALRLAIISHDLGVARDGCRALETGTDELIGFRPRGSPTREEAGVKCWRDETSRHVVGEREAGEIQQRRGDIEDARRGEPDGADSWAMERHDAPIPMPFLGLALDRRGKIGSIVTRAKPVVGQDQGYGIRSSRRDQFSEQCVLPSVKIGYGVVKTGEVGIGDERHLRR